MTAFLRHFKKCDDVETIKDALVKIGGDFEVAKWDMFTREKDDDTEFAIPNHVAIMRLDTQDVLGVVGRNYGVIQYLQGLEPLQTLVDQGDILIREGFIFGKGEKILLSFTDGNEINLGDDLTLITRYTFSTSHDGSLNWSLDPTPIRVDNGSVFTFPNSGRLKVRHSKFGANKLRDYTERFHQIQNFVNGEFAELAKDMGECPITFDQAQDYILSLIPGESTRAQNIREKIENIYRAGPHNAYPCANGTMLGVYLAVVDYADREKTVKKSKTLDSASCEVRSALMGDGARTKAEAWTAICTLKRKMKV